MISALVFFFFFESSKIVRRISIRCLPDNVMNVMRMFKATVAICVSIVQEVTIVSVQMDSKCHKTTRLVNVQKVSRSRMTGQCAWVSNNTKAVVGKKEDLMRPFS